VTVGRQANIPWNSFRRQTPLASPNPNGQCRVQEVSPMDRKPFHKIKVKKSHYFTDRYCPGPTLKIPTQKNGFLWTLGLEQFILKSKKN
jgi:hypothetical protein